MTCPVSVDLGFYMLGLWESDCGAGPWSCHLTEAGLSTGSDTMKVAAVLMLVAVVLAEPCCGQRPFFRRPGFAQGSGGAELQQFQQNGNSGQFVTANANVSASSFRTVTTIQQ